MSVTRVQKVDLNQSYTRSYKTQDNLHRALVKLAPEGAYIRYVESQQDNGRWSAVIISDFNTCLLYANKGFQTFVR